jgi:hypothetical protein
VSEPVGAPSEREGLAFFGAVAASVTHELNNVLSIVDQVSGLLGDLVPGASAGGTIDPGRLATLQGRIDRQVRKGIEIVRHLNNFAHSLDEPSGSFDAADVLDDLMVLSGRFAERGKVRLQRGDWEEWGGRGDAFRFHQAAFEALRWILAESGEGDEIEIGVRRDGQAGVVSISGTAQIPDQEPDEVLERLARVMRVLGGEHRISRGAQGGTVLDLRFPTASEGVPPNDGN